MVGGLLEGMLKSIVGICELMRLEESGSLFIFKEQFQSISEMIGLILPRVSIS